MYRLLSALEIFWECAINWHFTFLFTLKSGSQKATLVVLLVVVISSLRIQKSLRLPSKTMTEVIEITICVRFDCDTTTIRLRRIARACFHPFNAIRREQKMNMSIFRRSRIVVELELWLRFKCASEIMVDIWCIAVMQLWQNLMAYYLYRSVKFSMHVQCLQFARSRPGAEIILPRATASTARWTVLGGAVVRASDLWSRSTQPSIPPG